MKGHWEKNYNYSSKDLQLSWIPQLEWYIPKQMLNLFTTTTEAIPKPLAPPSCLKRFLTEYRNKNKSWFLESSKKWPKHRHKEANYFPYWNYSSQLNYSKLTCMRTELLWKLRPICPTRSSHKYIVYRAEDECDAEHSMAV